MTKENIRKRLKKPLEIIYNRGPKFRVNMERLHETAFFLKGRFAPFPKFSQTLGSRHIALAKRFFEWPVSSQASNLLHESVHEFQYEQMNGFPPFWLEYTRSKNFRMRAELGAFFMNISWWVSLGAMRWDFKNNGPNKLGKEYVDNVIKYFPKNYLLPWQRRWFNTKRQEFMRTELYIALKVESQ